MIRTFEELFEKMRLAGHDSPRLESMHEEFLHWRDQYRQSSGTAELAALVHVNKYRDSLQGYLSCLLETEYICQSEYDRLWNSLELPDIPEKGNTHDSNI